MIDFPRGALYEEVLEKKRENFFSDKTEDITAYCLAGSSGVPFDIEDPEDWVLQDFIKEHNFQPSKLRLYVVYVPQVSNIMCKGLIAETHAHRMK